MDNIEAFDTLYTNNHIQMCKLLLPSLPKDKQYLLAVLIKFWELSYVISCGRTLHCHPDSSGKKMADTQTILEEILPYCSKKEAETVHSMQQLFRTLDTVKTLSPMLDLIRQMQTQGNDAGGLFAPDLVDIFSMGDMLGGSISPEFLNLFDSLLHSASWDESARTQDESARSQDASARSQDASARSQDASARSQDASARSQDASARSQDEAARSQDVYSQDTSARTQDASTRSQDASARTQDESVHLQDTSVCSQDASG